MDILEARKLVADTGRLLLEKGLVARTWGNISCRCTDTSFAISPSGLGYENMLDSDVPIYDYEKDSYEGSRKPSSEKKIHAAAFKHYPEVNFVVHTHQDYATAVSLASVSELDMSPDEANILGKIEIAGYGLPGTGKLKKNVEAAFEHGSKIVLMVHHGAVILGKDRDDAIRKSELLEAVCKRAVEKRLAEDGYENIHAEDTLKKYMNDISKDVFSIYNNASFITNDDIIYCSKLGGIPAQLDDIAQMTGTKVICVNNNKDSIINALKKHKAVLVKDIGCVINSDDLDDITALEILVKKAALSYRYTKACKVKSRLAALDCILMKIVYTKKYSKQKKG